MPRSSRSILATALAILGLVAAGCGGDDDTTAQTTTPQTTPTSVFGITTPQEGATTTAPTTPQDGKTTPPPSTQPKSPPAIEEAGKFALALDALLRSSAEFAMQATRCVRGPRGEAEGCAGRALDGAKVARGQFEDAVDQLAKGASGECAAAVRRSKSAAAELSRLLDRIAKAAGTGDAARFNREATEVNQALSRRAQDLVAAQSACTG